MNLPYFHPQKRENVENINNSPVNIRFVAKTSHIRNFFENIKSDFETSEVATRLQLTRVDTFRVNCRNSGHCYAIILRDR